MYVFIPKNIDLESIEKQNPPSFNAYKKDKLAIVISHIVEKTNKMKDNPNFDGYGNISSKYLESLIDNYKQHIDYCIERGIVEKNPNRNFSQNFYCKSYKVITENIDDLQAYQINDYVLRKKLIKVERIKKRSKKD
jgi:hypothetical protein